MDDRKDVLLGIWGRWVWVLGSFSAWIGIWGVLGRCVFFSLLGLAFGWLGLFLACACAFAFFSFFAWVGIWGRWFLGFFVCLFMVVAGDDPMGEWKVSAVCNRMMSLDGIETFHNNIFLFSLS